MPELPEVETTVNGLRKKIVGKKIIDIWFDTPKIIKIPKAGELKKELKGARIEKIERRAKNILIYLDKNKLLLIHQKLTGHLLIGQWKIIKRKAVPVGPPAIKEKVNNYIHLIFYLSGGEMMALSDLRKFAKVLAGKRKEIENAAELEKLGPEPLEREFTFKKFKEIVFKKNKAIKKVLMDWEIISGIGNIYSDEILWRAGVHPLAIANKLKETELEKIYKSIKFILKKAIKLGGTSISDFRDVNGKSGRYGDGKFVYQRENQPCLKCKTLIKRIKIGGRSAHYCPKCQKIKYE